MADALVMDRLGLGHNLRPLERGALISIETSPDDRRSRVVTIGAAGATRMKRAMKLWRIAQDRFEEVVGPTEASRLRIDLLGIAHEERFAL